jgi:hypothetical protein
MGATAAGWPDLELRDAKRGRGAGLEATVAAMAAHDGRLRCRESACRRGWIPAASGRWRARPCARG